MKAIKWSQEVTELLGNSASKVSTCKVQEYFVEAFLEGLSPEEAVEEYEG